MQKIPINELFISQNDSIRSALQCIDQGGLSIALIVDEEQHLLGTISDGDIRRAILSGLIIDESVSLLLQRKANTQYSKPITALQGTKHDILIALMQQYALNLIPLVDDENRVIDIITLDDLIPTENLPVNAVIMAGGFGTRLRPYTDTTPKPMLPVGGRPLMEVIIEHLRYSGIKNVNITTHFFPEKIMDYFGDGSQFGININYINEKEPLGTGGALGLLPETKETMLVINGDVLTQINYQSMLNFHTENKADMTVAVKRYEVEIPYGVIDYEGVKIKGVKEKPRVGYFVNAGIYLLDPVVLQYIPAGKHFNMTDLIQWLIEADRNVVSFPVSEYWLDIGQQSDYAQAQKDVENGLMDRKNSNHNQPKKG